MIPKTRGSTQVKEQWGTKAITIDRNDLNLKDPTIAAVGLFGSIISRRADIIIVDDLVNQENAETKEQRQKIKDWFDHTLLPVLEPGGRLICTGNIWDEDDILSGFLINPLFDVKKRFSSIISESRRLDLWEEKFNILCNEQNPVRKIISDNFYYDRRKEMDDGIQVLWPEKFPYHDLYNKRKENPSAFAKMYQCRPLPIPEKDKKIKRFVF